MNSAKQHAKDQGGEIVHELDIIKGFSYVAHPTPAPLAAMTLMGRLAVVTFDRLLTR